VIIYFIKASVNQLYLVYSNSDVVLVHCLLLFYIIILCEQFLRFDQGCSFDEFHELQEKSQDLLIQLTERNLHLR